MALWWGSLIRNGVWSLKSSSAPGGICAWQGGLLHTCVHSRDLQPYRGLVGLWLWSSITHLSLWLGLCRVKEHCLFLVRGNS